MGVASRACAVGLVLSAGMLASCAGPPTEGEIDSRFNILMDQLNEQYQLDKIGCDGDSACIQKLNERYGALKDKLFEAKRAAIEKQWDHARDLEKEWHKKLRDMTPEWPAINDALRSLKDSKVTGDVNAEKETDGEITPIEGDERTYVYVYAPPPPSSGGNSPGGSPPPVTVDRSRISVSPLKGDRLRLRGSLAIESPDLAASSAVDGTMMIEGSTRPDGSYRGVVRGGNIRCALDVGGTLTMRIAPDEENPVEVGADGRGWITMLVSLSHSDRAWDVLTPDLMRLRFPIARTPEGDISIKAQATPIEEWLPRRDHPLSDYNRDGVLDFDSDFAAFSADFASHATLTDVTWDGVWDGADIQKWTDEFLEDLAAR